MYRLLATDIDDTLLAPDGSLPESNRAALRRLHDAHVAIVFCSGRSDISIWQIASTILPLDDDEYLISFNGARVVTAGSRRVVAQTYVSTAAIARIAEYTRKHDLHLQGYLGDDFIVETASPVAEIYANATGTPYQVFERLEAALPDGSPKLLIIGDPDILARHLKPLAELDDSLNVMVSKPQYVEIVAAGVNKGSALTRLAEKLGIPAEETVAVGDGGNDADMLRAAGLGIAVANAHPEANDAADIVLKSRSEDGAIEEIARRFFALR